MAQQPAPPRPELTRHQALIFEALSHAPGPMSAYALLEKLHDDGLRAPPQVYRALEKLTKYGLVHKLDSLNAFVACAHTHDDQHDCRHGVLAFAICDTCGHVDEFHDTAIEKRLKSWSSEHAFQPRIATIELHGACENCRARLPGG